MSDQARSKVEEVARAMHRYSVTGEPGGAASPYSQLIWEEFARVAIAALATKGMPLVDLLANCRRWIDTLAPSDPERERAAQAFIKQYIEPMEAALSEQEG